MLTFKEWQAISAVIGVVLAVLGWLMFWLRMRYGGDPEGDRPQGKAKTAPAWQGRPLSPAEWKALQDKGVSEEEIAKVDKAARWAGRSADDEPKAT